MKSIRETSKIYPGVKIGKNCTIGEYVVIGEPPRGKSAGELETIIGDNATIRSHTVIYSGNKIGDNFETGHRVLVREENKIGNNVSVGSNSMIEHHVDISDNVGLHANVFVPEYSILEDSCWLGPNVVLTNAKYPRSPNAKRELKGARIKTRAKIGANSTLCPGIIVGENSLIGAGSVVTKDVPSGVVFAGNPAKKIKNILELPYE